MIRQACTDAAGWPAGLRVHVNISARHLAEDGFSELVQSALDESGLAPDRLELEITESTALFAAEATLYAVAQVTEAGVTLALDDFGTGYSAITALHRLPIHTVKIDRSFVADVVTEPSTAALVHGLLQLGRGMGLQVIAEGIEDLDQADWLLRHGCAMAQGFAFGRPAPLPGRTEALVAEITDAPPVEPMTEETPARLVAEMAVPELDRPPGGAAAAGAPLAARRRAAAVRRPVRPVRRRLDRRVRRPPRRPRQRPAEEGPRAREGTLVPLAVCRTAHVVRLPAMAVLALSCSRCSCRPDRLGRPLPLVPDLRRARGQLQLGINSPGRAGLR